MLPSASVAVALVAALVSPVSACTNLLVSAGATADGSTLLAYNADSGNLYGSLGVYPATEHAPNATREVWDWDDSVFLGVIPEAARTFNVIGNANEHGLVMGETTFGGLPELDAHGTGGVMDYGSLIWIALQRCKTCACAIELIDALVQEHGYASDGESFSCADGTEAWLMELIGKGAYEKGAVWVATRVPEGAVLAHANQARTTTFARDDPKNVRFSNDVVSFARKIGRYPADAPDSSFDFTAAYDPVTFGGARHGEARVWDLYRRLVGDEAMTPYLEYAKGFDVTKRMPLFVFPAAPEPNTAAKLRVADVIRLMRARLEDSWFDPRGLLRADVGAGPGHSAYRARPLTWRDEASGRTFANERTVSTQQTAWTFVAASRAWMPAPARAIQWWAPDDSGTSLRVPVYGRDARTVPLRGRGGAGAGRGGRRRARRGCPGRGRAQPQPGERVLGLEPGLVDGVRRARRRRRADAVARDGALAGATAARRRGGGRAVFVDARRRRTHRTHRGGDGVRGESRGRRVPRLARRVPASLRGDAGRLRLRGAEREAVPAPPRAAHAGVHVAARPIGAGGGVRRAVARARRRGRGQRGAL